MREPSVYMSEEFVKIYFPAFAQTLKAERTADEYFSALCLYCDFIEKDFMQQTRDDALKYANYLKGRIDNGTFATSTMIIRMSCYRKLERFMMSVFPDVLNCVAWEQIQRPHLDSSISPERIPSIRQLDELLEASKSLGNMWYVLIALVLRCALTAGEVVSLRKRDFQIEGDYMYLHLDRKHNDKNFTKERQLRLTPDIRELVEKYMENMTVCDEKGHLFYNGRGNVLNQNNIRKTLIKLQDGLGFYYPISSIRSRAILELLEHTSSPDAVADFVDVSNMRIASFVEASGLIDDKRSVNEYVNISVRSCYPEPAENLKKGDCNEETV